MSATHTVTVEFSQHGMSPSLTFKCQAEPGAECRTTCPQSECEEGCVDPDNHEREPIVGCNIVDWLENGDDVETWIAGGDTEVTLPIEYAWTDIYDGPEWRFA